MQLLTFVTGFNVGLEFARLPSGSSSFDIQLLALVVGLTDSLEFASLPIDSKLRTFVESLQCASLSSDI